MSNRETGTVKWFNASRGYGFIERESGEDIFAHFKNIEGDGFRTLNDGEKVTFVVAGSPKGDQAEQIRRA